MRKEMFNHSFEREKVSQNTNDLCIAFNSKLNYYTTNCVKENSVTRIILRNKPILICVFIWGILSVGKSVLRKFLTVFTLKRFFLKKTPKYFIG